MNFEDEKDYIMRIIKEMVSVLFSVLLGRKFVSVELELANKYEVSGKDLRDLLAMVDKGDINEAENLLLDGMDYANQDELAAAALFYRYLSEKEEAFLLQNNYSKEEVLEGMKWVMQKAGYADFTGIME
jgi:hypothetical protein